LRLCSALSFSLRSRGLTLKQWQNKETQESGLSQDDKKEEKEQKKQIACGQW